VPLVQARCAAMSLHPSASTLAETLNEPYKRSEGSEQLSQGAERIRSFAALRMTSKYVCDQPNML
jgi:hypothetical protein